MDTPRGFIPAQDQANVAISITMPPGTSLARTDAIVQQVVPIVLGTPGVSSASVYSGMDGISFSNATSSGQMWAILEPFEERLPQGLTAQVIAAEIRKRLAGVTAADIRVTHARLGARPGLHRRLPHDGGGPRRPGLPGARGCRAAAQRGRGRRIRPSAARSAISTRAIRRSTPSSIATRPRCSACRRAMCTRRCRPILPAPTSTTSRCWATPSR